MPQNSLPVDIIVIEYTGSIFMELVLLPAEFKHRYMKPMNFLVAANGQRKLHLFKTVQVICVCMFVFLIFVSSGGRGQGSLYHKIQIISRKQI